jgi:hypothetical protein
LHAVGVVVKNNNFSIVSINMETANKTRGDVLIMDSLHNASLSVTSSEYDPPNLNKAQIYGRGVVVGVVGALMGLKGYQFKSALQIAKALLPDDFDIRCLPECWVEDYLSL